VTAPYDPFEAGQRESLRSTDALLDRIGTRAPTPDDLDDPVLAALALMAAEIDLDPVPVDATRAAIQRRVPGLISGPGRRPTGPRPAATVDDAPRVGNDPYGVGRADDPWRVADGYRADGDRADGHDADGDRADGDHADGDHADGRDPDGTLADGAARDDTAAGLEIDLRDRPGYAHARDALRRRLSAAGDPAGAGWAVWPPRRLRGRRHRPGPAMAAVAPPRSRPSTPSAHRAGSAVPSTRPPATVPPARRERRMGPLTALVVALAAIVLGSGVSAAVTGGRSVNPLTGVQEVVAQLTTGRTAEQTATYDRDVQLLHEARAAASGGDRATMIGKLAQVSTAGLSPTDASSIEGQRRQVPTLLPPR